MTNFNIQNYSKIEKLDNSSSRQDRYDWCVFIDEPEQKLNDIKQVKYILHPTFPNPERIVESANNKFALFSNGWGSFMISVEIFLKDGGVVHQDHYLRISDNNWPFKDINSDDFSAEDNEVYDIIKSSSYNWRRLSTIVKISDLPENEVVESIEKLEEANLVRDVFFQI